MSFEVEIKFRAHGISDLSELRERLLTLGATQLPSIEQCDRYFNHPARDFGETDEALRIRQTDGQIKVTYKGPKVDPIAKTRREIEIALSGANADGQFADILTELGFRETLAVSKNRETWQLDWQGLDVEFVLDTVGKLGSFIELETVAGESNITSARDSLLTLAEKLGLEKESIERRSYLEMLLESKE